MKLRRLRGSLCRLVSAIGVLWFCALFSSNIQFPKEASTESSKFSYVGIKNARQIELKKERKVAIWNTCTGISSQCSLTANYAYIFYASNIYRKTTSSPGIISNSSVSRKQYFCLCNETNYTISQKFSPQNHNLEHRSGNIILLSL